MAGGRMVFIAPSTVPVAFMAPVVFMAFVVVFTTGMTFAVSAPFVRAVVSAVPVETVVMRSQGFSRATTRFL